MPPVHQRSLVNQRLYFCRLHVDWLREQLDKQLLPKHVVEQALGESLIFHLVLTYRAYLVEIAQSCALPCAALDNATELIAHLQQADKVSAIACELLQLETSDSWLHVLLMQYQQLQLQTPSPAVSSASTIQVRQLESDCVESVAEGCREFYEMLNDLIAIQRTQLEEW